ncbi:iron-sulfur cluster co-chaperone protein HscB, mitochondrial, partial [Clarias magur]
MFLLTSTLIFISAVVYECHAEQTLDCKYDSVDRGNERVWCKRDANNHSCCTGFSFTENDKQLDNNQLSVKDNGSVFTVSVKSLSLGDGVYWCGIKRSANVIIKLNEAAMYNSMDFVWSVMRWLILAGLLVAVISTHVFYRGTKEKRLLFSRVHRDSQDLFYPHYAIQCCLLRPASVIRRCLVSQVHRQNPGQTSPPCQDVVRPSLLDLEKKSLLSPIPNLEEGSLLHLPPSVEDIPVLHRPPGLGDDTTLYRLLEIREQSSTASTTWPTPAIQYCLSCSEQERSSAAASTAGQELNPKGRNVCRVPGDQTFALDTQKLQGKYIELQRSLHPDNFSQKSQTEQKYSEEQSSLVNKAYRTLQKPVTRSVYLMHLRGVELESGTDPVADPALLLKVMEVNEKLAGTRSVCEVNTVGQEVQETLKTLNEQMNAALNK